MRKIGLRKTFIYVFAFLMTLCAVLAFSLTWKQPTVSASAATTYTQLTGHSDWSVSGAGSVIDNENGHGWSGSGEYQLKSTRKAWVDRFGVAFRVQKGSGKMRVVVVPDKTAWYTEQSTSISMEFERTGAENATLGLWIGTSGLASYSNLYIDWTNAYENRVYLGKTDSGWVINVGGTPMTLDATASSALETALTAYTDKVGYLQVHNISGDMDFTYTSVLFGLPSSKTPDTFVAPILSPPNWSQTYGNEVAAWTPTKDTVYTVSSSIAMPLKGLEIDLRMAPAEGITRNIIAFTSLHQHNWYSGTYTIAFNFDYNPAVHGDNSVSLQFMVYTPTTEATKEQPIKITQQVPFKWYETNKIQFYKLHGVWGIKLNGEDIFVDATDADGLTVDDHFKRVAPFYEDNAAYLQLWGRGNGLDPATVPYDGCIVEYMKRLDEVTGETSIMPNLLNFAELQTFEFKTNIQVRIAMSDLFTVTGATDISYLSTCGRVQSNGVWAYTARGVGEQWITMRCSAGGKMEEYDVLIRFIEGPAVVAPAAQEVTFKDGLMSVTEVEDFAEISSSSGGGSAEGGCGSTISGGVAITLSLAALTVITKKRRRG
ncbi:MAG: hypothetical protein IJY11_02615 [Clostridia bacterium]|nr:hypothetical protein [Clostridia bacterium]